MKFAEQKTFIREKPDKVISYLKNVQREVIKVKPYNLRLVTGKGSDSEKVLLMVVNGEEKFFEVRESFLHKLMKWYSFPLYILDRLSTETILSAANDFLLNIKSDDVFVKLENGQALTITSGRYADLPDLEILNLCSELGIDIVSRNDFFMSIYSSQKYNFEPVKGDLCGFGVNIFNSETGFGALKISHYILRYVCRNGATASTGLYESKPLVHSNISREFVLDYINKSLEEINNSRSLLFSRLSGLKSMESEKILVSVKRKLTGVVGYQESDKLIKEYNRKTKQYSKEFDGSQYSLFNFITLKAKNYNEYKRTTLENLAGNIFLS